jgi:hypothetical protein
MLVQSSKEIYRQPQILVQISTLLIKTAAVPDFSLSSGYALDIPGVLFLEKFPVLPLRTQGLVIQG